jgi:hypothetical protein
MKRLFWLSLVIVVLAAFYASANPDGLEFVSEKLGFIDKGTEWTSPFPDYRVGFLFREKISRISAGILGIAVLLFVFRIAATLIKSRENRSSAIKQILILFSLLLISPSHAFRPLVTDDFGVLDFGKNGIEAGYTIISPKGSASTGNMAVYIKRGLLPNVEFGIEAPYSLANPSGVGDLILHTKIKCLCICEYEGFSTRIDIKLKNADAASGLGTGYYSYSLTGIYSRNTGPCDIHMNAGYTVNESAAAANVLNYSSAVVFDFWGPDQGIMAEYLGTNSAGNTTSSLLAGIRRLSIGGLILDTSYTIGLDNISPNIFVAGLTAEF